MAKLPANIPAPMCVKVEMGTVWVLDRHVVFLWISGGTMRIVKVNSRCNCVECFLWVRHWLDTGEQGTQVQSLQLVSLVSNDTALDQVVRMHAESY